MIGKLTDEQIKEILKTNVWAASGAMMAEKSMWCPLIMYMTENKYCFQLV